MFGANLLSIDAQNCKVLEDWTRAPENRDVTKMPAQFRQVEAAVIGGMQKLLYLSEVKSSEIIVWPDPPHHCGVSNVDD